MGKLFCVMGKSASGKDTIFKRLAADASLGLRTVVPYTTRPIREGEHEGVEYHFTDEAGYQAWKAAGKIIEARAYHTVHGLWRYFTADDGQICPDQGNFIVIGTLEAYRQMLNFFGPEVMVPVYVEVEDGLRLSRALLRSGRSLCPNMRKCAGGFWRTAKISQKKKLKIVTLQKDMII